MFISYNPEAYINGKVMMNWIRQLYNKETEQHRDANHQSDKNSILFLYNCSSHKTPKVLECMRENKIDYQFFPPNTTPILQPLDHSNYSLIQEKVWREL